MRRKRAALIIVTCLAAGALVAWLVVLSRDPERELMYERYERIQIGGKYADVGSQIDMPTGGGGLGWRGRPPELIEGSDPTDTINEMYSYFTSERYSIMVQYDGDTDVILRKGLYRSADRRGLMARLFGP